MGEITVKNLPPFRGDVLAVSALLSLFLVLASRAPVLADETTYQFDRSRWYVSVAVGGNTSRDVVVESRSNDRASICDEYINPEATTIPACTTPDRGAGDGWLAPFEPGSGFSGELDVGFRLTPRFRVSAAYTYTATNFDQVVSSTDAMGADFDKISNELSIGEETLGSVLSDELSLVVYHDWANRTRWTPFAGVGLSLARTSMDFSWLWSRSTQIDQITTGLGQPNADEIRRNLAGTVSVGRRTLRDVNEGYVVAAGIDREFTDRVSMGFKVQWKHSAAFESGEYTGDLLRSHPPNLRLDNSEPVSTWSTTGDTARLSALLTIRYSNGLVD